MLVDKEYVTLFLNREYFLSKKFSFSFRGNTPFEYGTLFFP